MIVATAFELTNKKLSLAKKAGVSDLVFHHLHPSVTLDALSSFRLHNSGNLNSESKNYVYLKVQKQIEKLYNKAPSFFYYNGYDLKQALIKDLYWSLIIENLLEHKILESKLTEAKIISLEPIEKNYVSYLKLFFRIFHPVSLAQYVDKSLHRSGKIAVRINSLRSLPLFGKLPETLTAAHFFSFQTFLGDSKKTAESLQSKLFDNLPFLLKKKIYVSDFFLIIKLIFSSDIQFLNLMISNKRKLISSVHIFEELAKMKVSGFLLNAAENEGEGIVAGMVAEKYKLKCANFMNGTKSKDLINSYTRFDYWFMHDVKMQELLLEISNQKQENFPVVGHLMEDVAKTHVYAGTLDAWKNILTTKRIISIFTSATYAVEQLDVLKLLEKFLNENSDTLVFVRQHPDEKHPLVSNHERMIVLPNFKEKSSLGLFDLLQVSQLAISFGSTVSLQASWMQVPSVTFEYTPHSLLLYVDNKRIHHINSIEKLELFMNQIATKVIATPNSLTSEKSVAQKMTDILLK